MTSMREKIARAIYSTDDRIRAWAEWDDLEDDDPTRLSSFKRADAVLDALMEPTEGMFRAGYEKDIMALRGCDSIFVAMITADKEGK